MIIDCRTEHDSYFPDPDDCHYFYHCSDWAGLEHKHCGPALYFHPQKNVCDWPYIVRRVRHDCPPGDTPGHQELPLRVVDIDSKEETTPAFDDGSYIRSVADLFRARRESNLPILMNDSHEPAISLPQV